MNFFHNLAYVCGKNDRIFTTILPYIYRYLWTTKAPLNVVSHPDVDSRSALTEVCVLQLILFFVCFFISVIVTLLLTEK